MDCWCNRSGLNSMTIDKVIFIYEEDHKQYFLCELSNKRYSIFVFDNKYIFSIKINPNAKYIIVDKKKLAVLKDEPTYSGKPSFSFLSSYMKCYKHIKEDEVMFFIMQHT